MSRSSSELRAAEAAPRPELPLEGFRIVRRPDDEWPVVTDAQGRLLHAPEARVQRAAATDDGALLALEVADSGSESGRLVLVDRQGRARSVPTPPLRYADLAWAGSLLHCVDAEGRWLEVDASTGRCTVVRDQGDARPRLVPVGGGVLLAVRRTDEPARSMVLARDGSTALELPLPRAVVRGGSMTLVVADEELLLLRPTSDGRVGVRASRATGPRTDGVLLHASAHPAGAVVHVMQAAGSRLLELDAELRLVREVVPCGGDIGAVTGLSWADARVWVRVESPAGPPRVLALDAVADAPVEAPYLPSRMKAVTVDDGATVDLVVTGDAAGPAPLLLEVYGGFGLADVPVFEPSVAAWCALGGLHVTARIRGGGGAGSAWHRAAQGARKGRAVADTVDVARALVTAGLTRPDLLVVAGASHGGLVAASAALHAPDLVAGVACTAAPLDPHRIEEHPLASAWRDEFGCPTDEAVRAAMDDYSPLRRLERWPAGARLPRFLLTTFAEDTRVDRAATDRFAAALRGRDAPVVRHHRPAMGHGRNARTDVHAFAASVLDFALDSTGTA